MSSWRELSLSDVLEPRLDRVSPEAIATERLSVIAKISFAEGRIVLRPDSETKTGMIRVCPGDLVVSGINAYKGAIALYDGQGPAAATIHYASYRVREERAVPRFLWYLLRSRFFQRRLEESVPGGIKTELKPARFLPVKVPIPSVTEQQRIVGRIEVLAGRVAEACSLRRQSVEVAEALSRSVSRHVFGASVQSNWIPLSRYIAEIENGKSPATEGRPAESDEWAVLKVGAVSFGFFDERENKALPASFTPISRFEVKPGDFIMSRANTAELVGACAVVRKTRPKLMLSDKIFRFIFREPQQVELSYLDQALKSWATREQIVATASGTSPTMKNISKEKVLNLRLPLHSLSEQRRIVAYLDGLQAKADPLKRRQSETSAELDALLPSVLDRAFRGEL